MKRLAKALAVVLAVGLLAVGGGGRWYLGRSLPRLDGEMTLAGLSAPVDIVRDANAVPHIFAANEPDAYFGLGYVHAQDRLWQMEQSRRLASGTLAEVLGEAALEQDRVFRTLGLRRVAEKNVEALAPEIRLLVDAYVRGVNAFLGERNPLPPEFVLLRFEPKPWTAADSVAWLRVMAFGLSGNLNQELQRVGLRGKLTPQQITEFFAPYPGDAPVPLPDSRALYGNIEQGAHTLLAQMPMGTDRPVGSNNWVVDGSRTASGKPLLANDPHLELTAPALWYFAHLNAPGLNVVGASFPGLPAIVLGRNDDVAWSFTNTQSDVQDFFVEKPMPGDPGSYATPAGSEPFEVRMETLLVKGRSDETLRVRSSRHGPIVSDVLEDAARVMPEGEVLALRSTALEPDDRSVQFPILAARAKNADEFLAATRSFHSPQQNIVYADTHGAIGFIAAGRVPLRGPDNDVMGRMPVPGWISKYDWKGFVPWEELPREEHPSSGKIVTANQKITPPGYPHTISTDWGRPYRAERIASLLDAVPKHSSETFQRIQLDLRSGTASVLLPYLRRIESQDPEERAMIEKLRAWNGEMTGASFEPLVFAAWVRELPRQIYQDEVGDFFSEVWSERVVFLRNVLADVDGQGRWCDDVRTPAAEGCGDIVAKAFHEALAYLKKEYGTNPEHWSWSAAHPAHSAHMVLGQVPVLSRWFNVDVPGVGDNETVNVGGYSVDAPQHPFTARSGPGFRAVYDLADPEQSVFVLSTGQSGHPLSSHYGDLSALWSRGAYVPLRTERSRVDAERIGLLRLRPRGTTQETAP